MSSSSSRRALVRARAPSAHGDEAGVSEQGISVFRHNITYISSFRHKRLAPPSPGHRLAWPGPAHNIPAFSVLAEGCPNGYCSTSISFDCKVLYIALGPLEIGASTVEVVRGMLQYRDRTCTRLTDTIMVSTGWRMGSSSFSFRGLGLGSGKRNYGDTNLHTRDRTGAASKLGIEQCDTAF
jgi:hypothetical protein